MKKLFLIGCVIAAACWGWHVYNDGAYNPKAKYIGNKKSTSWVYHRKSCKSVKRMAERNKFYSLTKEKLINKGMKACGNCRP